MSLERFKAEHCPNLAEYAGKGPAWTLTHRGEIVASAGFYVMWPGVAEAWLTTTPLVYKYPLYFWRGTKEVFKRIDEQVKFRRIQATVKAADQRAIKYLKHLGFTIEGFMPKYGPDGSDHYMIGRVK